MADEVVLLSFWASPFGIRVQIALAEKGIEYEFKEEHLLMNKSPFLLEVNPVFKKIPVLIHNGKPICESLSIVEYIDDVWKQGSSLFPSDPYQRANARFWADFIDKKIYDVCKKIWRGKGKEIEDGKKELIDIFKLLEEELGDKVYFGGDDFGVIDISLVPFYSRFYSLEICGNFSIERECPKLVAWARRCLERESVAKCLPDPLKVYEWILQVNKKLGIS